MSCATLAIGRKCPALAIHCCSRSGYQGQVHRIFRGRAAVSRESENEIPDTRLSWAGPAPGFIIVCSNMRWETRFRYSTTVRNLTECIGRTPSEYCCSRWPQRQCRHIWRLGPWGYNVWWVSAIGLEGAQKAMRPLLDIPDEISMLDILLSGSPATQPYKRHRKPPEEITHMDKYTRAHF
jgi:hypothetical protein